MPFLLLYAIFFFFMQMEKQLKELNSEEAETKYENQKLQKVKYYCTLFFLLKIMKWFFVGPQNICEFKLLCPIVIVFFIILF